MCVNNVSNLTCNGKLYLEDDVGSVDSPIGPGLIYSANLANAS